MKYVILEEKCHKSQTTRIHPLIFPEHMTHSTVAAGYLFAMTREGQKTLTMLTAGFCHLVDNGRWKCEHGSESLKLTKDLSLSILDEHLLNMPNAAQGLIPTNRKST